MSLRPTAVVISALLLTHTSVTAQEQTNQEQPRPNQSAGDTDQQSNQQPDQSVQKVPQVLKQGPIHEAFAKPLSFDLNEKLIVDKTPPEPIEELPAGMRPEGENVQWIPGYWMWHAPQDDFVWVSGVWRKVPPGRRWVPGYWTEVEDGHQWIGGFWTSAENSTVEYLPYPPKSLEQGPSQPAPGDDYFWVPGNWSWRNTRYAWAPGYWATGQQNWNWNPGYYSYTPRGAVYVSGFWDYPLANRGSLFAPVYWQNRGLLGGGYVFRPGSTINTGLLLTSLFIWNDYPQYYYGPYGAFAGNQAFQPWYAATGGYSNWQGYNPLLAYYSWRDFQNRNDWLDQLHQRYDNAARNQRPDAEQVDSQLVQRVDRGERQTVGYRGVSEEDLASTRQRAQRMNEFSERRRQAELDGSAPPARLDSVEGQDADVRQADDLQRPADVAPVDGDFQPESLALPAMSQRQSRGQRDLQADQQTQRSRQAERRQRALREAPEDRQPDGQPQRRANENREGQRPRSEAPERPRAPGGEANRQRSERGQNNALQQQPRTSPGEGNRGGQSPAPENPGRNRGSRDE